jgi:hypothetical protein
VLGASLAIILYFRNRKDDLPQSVTRLLAVIRFFSISLISFLLLSPLIRSVTRTYEKPIVIVALDNSLSILNGKDSVYYQTTYLQSLERMVDELNHRYDLRVYTFGDKLSRTGGDEEPLLSFTGQQTNLSAVFDEVTNAYPNRNVGAVVLASDGIYNSGLNPLYSSRNLRYPLYTLALGDTSLQKDVILAKVNYNRVAYLGNNFPIEIIVKSLKYNGNRTRISVSNGDSVLFTQIVDFTGDHFTKSIYAELEATRTGLQRFRISASALPEEFTTLNNTYDISVEVLDSRQKILILFNSPHPDVSALKSAILTNYNYEVEDFPVSEFRNELTGYNLVVMHQLPAKNQSQPVVVDKVMDSGLPVLFIVGSQTDLNALNRLKRGLEIIPQQSMTNEALPVWNENFVLFQTDEETREDLLSVPPLNCPFGEYRLLPNLNIMLYQKIGRVTTDLPLILFSENQEGKTGFVTGEGLWKWRLNNFARRENHRAFNQIVLKVVQYLVATDEKGFFRVTCTNSFPENEAVEFDAEVYNKSYEPINDPDVELVIENEEGARFPFVFARKGRSYHLSAGSFPPGNYSYHVTVKVGQDLYEKRGVFSVEDLNVEKTSTVADHSLLFTLAGRHDGQMLYPNQLDQLPDLLGQRDDIHTVIYTQKTYNEFNNIIWVLVVIVMLLATEWFIRKYKGTY